MSAHPWNTVSMPASVPTTCSICGGKGCAYCIGSVPKVIYPGTSIIAPGLVVQVPRGTL